jgi:glycerophosphoryl diester phosphodiesterase
VEQVREVAPDVPRSVLFGPASFEEMVAVCRRVGATYVHPCFRHWKETVEPVWTAETVERFHTAGLTVMTPHTNVESEAAEFGRIGVDVIASDDPRVLAQFGHA